MWQGATERAGKAGQTHLGWETFALTPGVDKVDIPAKDNNPVANYIAPDIEAKKYSPAGACSPGVIRSCNKNQRSRALGNNPSHPEFLSPVRPELLAGDTLFWPIMDKDTSKAAGFAIITPTCAVEAW